MENLNFRELFKKLLNFDNPFGKITVTAAYYCVAAAIAVNCVVSFIYGIALVTGGSVLIGLGKILFCVPLAVLYLVLLRLFCELALAAFDHFDKQ